MGCRKHATSPAFDLAMLSARSAGGGRVGVGISEASPRPMQDISHQLSVMQPSNTWRLACMRCRIVSCIEVGAWTRQRKGGAERSPSQTSPRKNRERRRQALRLDALFPLPNPFRSLRLRSLRLDLEPYPDEHLQDPRRL